MPFVYNFPFFSIFICMISGIVTPLLKNGRWAYRLSLFASGAGLLLSGVLLGRIGPANESFSFMMGHFPAPWGNELSVGPLEAVLATAVCLVMMMALLGGSRDIFEDVLPEKQKLYFIMMDEILAALLALTYTNDIFTAYVFIEISTIAACAIVMAKDASATLVATMRYLIMSLLGSGLVLIGIVLLYCITGHLLFPSLQQRVLELVATGQYTIPLTVVVGLIVLGLGIKSAMFPFHLWLPPAHGSATTASSSVLSGLVVKGYIILMIRLFYKVFTIEVIRELRITNMIFLFGLAGMIIGSIGAMKEGHIKRMLAYSSVAQLGYVFMGIGLGTDIGIMAACFQILVHACTKPMLFSCASALSAGRHHNKKLHALRGAAYENKLAGIGFTVGALSMIGIPLFAGFAAKVFFASATMAQPVKMWMTLLTLALSTVLNALYYIPAVTVLWSRPAEGETGEKQPVYPAFAVSTVVFIAAVFFLGICYEPVVTLIQNGLALL